MTNNVKPGDRAIIVGAKHPENNMAIVEVIERCMPGAPVPGADGCTFNPGVPGVTWVVESLGRALVQERLRADGSTMQVERRSVGIVLDSGLRRLPDDPDAVELDVSVAVQPVAGAVS